jgi:nickel/cobalt exporter
MTDTALNILLWTAVSIGFIHTLIGPDHYLPFIVIGKARNWSIPRTLSITILCGLGHVLSSVLIGAIGIAIGTAAGNLKSIESVRGEVASYALIIFGMIYGIWGLWRARKGHSHKHLPNGEHLDNGNARSVTFWTLFIVFVLGPCEPLIPILMFPAVKHDWYGVVIVTLAFGVATISTMCALVYAASKGLSFIKTQVLEKYVHAMAGGIIALSGMAIKIFGI